MVDKSSKRNRKGKEDKVRYMYKTLYYIIHMYLTFLKLYSNANFANKNNHL